VLGLPREAAVGGLLVQRLGAGIDHRETSVELPSPVRHEAPAELLDAPAFAVVHDGEHPLGGSYVEALEPVLRRWCFDAEGVGQLGVDVV
jgi:hypothetical protein